MIYVIFGPEASGKMTIGQELCKLDPTLNLCYNHQVIDMIGTIFNRDAIGHPWNMDPECWDLIAKIWDNIIKFSLSTGKNLIFTTTLDFNNEGMVNYLYQVEKEAKKIGSEVRFIELLVNREERLKRNNTENRLQNKICKRNVEESNETLIKRDETARLNSNEGELKFEKYLRLHNNGTAAEGANTIFNYFSFK